MYSLNMHCLISCCYIIMYNLGINKINKLNYIETDEFLFQIKVNVLNRTKTNEKNAAK